MEINTQNIQPAEAPDKMRSYKSDCLRLGFYLTVILLIREIAAAFSPLLALAVNGLSSDQVYVISLLYSALCLQIIPSFLAVFMLKYSFKNMCGGFHPPKKSKRAFANFPVIYGVGMTINLLTMLLMYLITGTQNNTQTVTGLTPTSMPTALFTLISLVIIAPFFEEFIFRGAVMNILKPYDGRIAVFVSAFCFGIYHANFYQFFYTFALGICLGYITYATGSIFCSTVLHAMFNSVSGIMLIFMSSSPVQKASMGYSDELSDGESLVVTFFAIYMIIVILTAVIGFLVMIKKLRHASRYRLPVVWREVSGGKKFAALILTVTIIISILLMADVMVFGFVADGIQEIIALIFSAA